MFFGAVADDLTGGAELASMLVARGVATGFTVGADAAVDSHATAHVIALKTRVAPVDDAVAQVLAAAEKLLAAGAQKLFFKYCATFDSTPAGNIGPCAEALLDRLGSAVTLFTPALCETRRTVFQGHMFGGAQLLSESPKRLDPLTPMTDSNLVRVLSRQSRSKVGLIAHDVIDRGADAIRAAIDAHEEAGERLLLTDTLYERDLATIAEAEADLALTTGNSSVAAHLPPAWRRRGWIGADSPAPEPLPAVDGPAAVLAGSVDGRTASQLARFGAHHPVLMVDLSEVFDGRFSLDDIRRFAAAHLPHGPVAVATTAPPDAVEALQRARGRAGAAARAEALLGETARLLVEEFGLRRLVIAGGETSGAVLKALGIDRLLVGPYQGPGLSLAVAASRPLALLLKSGKLGGDGIFLEALEAMRRPGAVAIPTEEWPPARKFAG